ncbi:MAG: hypothetical protein HY841_11195 [Bacteroidetes bacterium]|nr:hypothetical protein [Bacteroidota bacterium]
MKNSCFIKITTVAFLFVLMAASIISCKKKDPELTLPPSSSMAIEVGNFWDGTAKLAGTATDTTKSNLIFAGTNVLVWNVILTVGLAVPVASFAESFKHQAEWNKKSKDWVWSYSVPVGNDSYSCKLHGKEDGDNVNWSMHLSKDGGFSDFIWYTGTSKKDNTSGVWTLNDNPTNKTPLLQIDWTKNSIGTCDIRYTNVVPGGAENGGYINYGIASDPVYDAYYYIYNKGQNNLTSIKWNRSSMAGRVLDQFHFSDSQWHCWNTVLVNDTCQ